MQLNIVCGIRRRITHVFITTSVACAVLGQVAACAGSGRDAASPAPPAGGRSPSAGASSTALGPVLTPHQPALILAGYRRFWLVASAASRQPPTLWRRSLSAVSVEPLLSHLVDGLAEQHAKGLAEYGAVVLHPTIVHAEPQRASIVDCQDASKSGTLEVATGAVRTVGAARTPLTAVMERGSDGRWRLSEARLLDGSC
jgi:hypothetical protein